MKRTTPATYTFIPLFIALITTLLCIADNPDNRFSAIWLLPLTFSFSSVFLCLGVNITDFIFSKILYIVYFIRMVVIPLLYSFSGEISILSPNVYEGYILEAIIIMCYENIVIFAFLAWILSKNTESPYFEKSGEYVLSSNNKPTKKISLVVLSSLLVVVLILRMDSTIGQHVFVSVLGTDYEYYALSDSSTGLGTINMYANIICALFKVIQILLPPLLIYYISKMRIPVIKYLFSVGVLLLTCLYSTEDRIDALLAGFACLFTMKSVYSEKFNKFSNIVLIAIIFIAFDGLYLKATLGEGSLNPIGKLTSTISAYFSGIPTVALGADFLHNTSHLYFLQLPGDVFSRIPFFRYVVGLLGFGADWPDTNANFNFFLQGYLGRNYGQILPSVIVGSSYFGFLLGPFYLCLFVYFAYKANIKLLKTNSIIKRNLFYWFTISLSMTTIVMSVLLFVAKIFWFFLMYVILGFSKSKK